MKDNEKLELLPTQCQPIQYYNLYLYHDIEYANMLLKKVNEIERDISFIGGFLLVFLIVTGIFSLLEILVKYYHT